MSKTRQIALMLAAVQPPLAWRKTLRVDGDLRHPPAYWTARFF